MLWRRILLYVTGIVTLLLITFAALDFFSLFDSNINHGSTAIEDLLFLVPLILFLLWLRSSILRSINLLVLQQHQNFKIENPLTNIDNQIASVAYMQSAIYRTANVPMKLNLIFLIFFIVMMLFIAFEFINVNALLIASVPIIAIFLILHIFISYCFTFYFIDEKHFQIKNNVYRTNKSILLSDISAVELTKRANVMSQEHFMTREHYIDCIRIDFRNRRALILLPVVNTNDLYMRLARDVVCHEESSH